MADLLGFFSILLVTLFVLALAKKSPAISLILIFAFLLRIFLSLFNYYIGGLPESNGDAIIYEQLAWNWSQGDLSTVLSRYSILSHFDHTHKSVVSPAYFLSWLLALLYNLTDRSLLMAQTISVMFGMGSVYLGWKISGEIWSEQVAKKCAWVMAFFPSWVLYSALFMREVYIYFFTLFALIAIVKWVKYNNFKYIIGAVVGFIAASLFHGAMILGLFVFLVFVFYRSSKDMFKAHLSVKTFFVQLIIVILGILIAIAFFQSAFTIPYIDNFEDISVNKIIERIARTAFGESQFPDWLLPYGFWDLIWKTPIRIFYFMFSPMPWNISEPIHLFGVMDGLLYVVLFTYLWKWRKKIIKEPPAKIFITMLAVYMLVFSLGIGNSGTALRHRAKLFPIIVVLTAPLIPVINISNHPIIRRKDQDE
jgi:4-amino-4-deoxy-L-arabinose transferase-like glycosyltransferase